jgi:hypothetical protein
MIWCWRRDKGHIESESQCKYFCVGRDSKGNFFLERVGRRRAGVWVWEGKEVGWGKSKASLYFFFIRQRKGKGVGRGI